MTVLKKEDNRLNAECPLFLMKIVIKARSELHSPIGEQPARPAIIGRPSLCLIHGIVAIFIVIFTCYSEVDAI
jgi:hypothetical protein